MAPGGRDGVRWTRYQKRARLSHGGWQVAAYPVRCVWRTAVKAVEASFLTFLKKSEQLEIPIYQRTYSWTRKECMQLWTDLVHTITEEIDGHFVGSIVYIATGIYVVGGINTIEVIDGQQRLTTVSLMILALARALESRGDDAAKLARRLMRDYLLQDDEQMSGAIERYKLLPTKSDRDTYMRLVDGHEIDPTTAPRLAGAYQVFQEQIQRSPVGPEKLLRGIERLLMVDIALDREHDNPQLIFESLNSTGLDLSQADLIRNFVLMGKPSKVQADIYNNSWYPLEQLFPADRQYMFDQFVRDYLTMETTQIARIDAVYEAFKSLARSGKEEVAELVAELYRNSKNWVMLAFDRATDPALSAAIADLNQLRVDVAYPFLLAVLNDRDQGTISDAEAVATVRLIESYVFRRALAGIPTNTLNKTFAALASEIDKHHYIESLQAALLLKESYARFPTDTEVSDALRVKDVYNFRGRNYLLRRLENFGRKERVDVDSYTIEHVMPQNSDLSPEWQEELGPDWREVHEKYLHTLGNLTLTGYNSELSDRSFREKLSMPGGFRESPLRLNNQYLAKLVQWNEHEIQARADQLINTVLEIWPAPRLSEEVLAKYRKPKWTGVWTLADHPALIGPIRELFDELSRRTLNLDAGVHEQIRKQYIAYSLSSNFLEVVPLATELKLYLDISVDELQDPAGLARDVTAVGHWGTGNLEVRLAGASQLDDVMALIRQAFERQGEEPAEPSDQWSRSKVEAVVEQIQDPALQAAVLELVEAVVRNGLYPRPSKYSLMIAPPTNRTRALFTLALRDGALELWTGAEPFETFYGFSPAEVERCIGPEGRSILNVDAVQRLIVGIDELMAGNGSAMPAAMGSSLPPA